MTNEKLYREAFYTRCLNPDETCQIVVHAEYFQPWAMGFIYITDSFDLNREDLAHAFELPDTSFVMKQCRRTEVIRTAIAHFDALKAHGGNQLEEDI